MILLDTCSLLWLAMGSPALSQRARDLLVLPDQRVFACAISAFEIGQKARAGKLILPIAAREWFPGILQQHGLLELPVTAAICLRAAALPQRHHDPFDRLLIAAAAEHGLVLLTPDEHIKQYSEISTLW